MDRSRDPRHRNAPDADSPHDILAAEAFALGEADPGLHREPAHDVLAAEAFAVGGADRGRPATPPDEHSDDPAPHDILAAEEYAMPAAGHHALPPEPVPAGRGRPAWVRWLATGAGLLALRALLRSRRAR